MDIRAKILKEKDPEKYYEYKRNMDKFHNAIKIIREYIDRKKESKFMVGGVVGDPVTPNDMTLKRGEVVVLENDNTSNVLNVKINCNIDADRLSEIIRQQLTTK